MFTSFLESIRKYINLIAFLLIFPVLPFMVIREKFPVRESDKRKPVSPYGFHKLQAEMICDEFSQFFGIKTCSLRIFSAFGEGLEKQLFWDLSQKMRNSENGVITLFGTGNETRDFIYVKDVAKTIELIVNSKDNLEKYYNVASGIETSIREAVELFTRVMNWKGEIEFNNYSRAGDPLKWSSDIGSISNLGFAPKYTLEEGLIRYAAWIKKKTRDRASL